tara:strand:+ start:67 stop:246 length:180 start_codon:yes stop_codon:yes gene_type:complete
MFHGNYGALKGGGFFVLLVAFHLVKAKPGQWCPKPIVKPKKRGIASFLSETENSGCVGG